MFNAPLPQATMKLICNSIGKCSECIHCGAARVHHNIGCDDRPCPFVEEAKCIELEAKPIDEMISLSQTFLYQVAKHLDPKITVPIFEYCQNFLATQNRLKHRVEYKEEGEKLAVTLYTLKTPKEDEPSN